MLALMHCSHTQNAPGWTLLSLSPIGTMSVFTLHIQTNNSSVQRPPCAAPSVYAIGIARTVPSTTPARDMGTERPYRPRRVHTLHRELLVVPQVLTIYEHCQT